MKIRTADKENKHEEAKAAKEQPVKSATFEKFEVNMQKHARVLS